MSQFERYLPWVLAFGVALILMSTDIYAPCLPAMMREFSASESALQWTLSLNSFGYCAVSPFVGPLADAYGRRKVILYSTIGFAFSSFGCALSSSLWLFDVWRIIQGICSAAVPIVSLAVLADIFEGRRFGSIMAYMGIVITLSFAVAPMIGGAAGQSYGWRSIFYGVGGISCLLIFVFYKFLPETLKHKKTFSLKHMVKTYEEMLGDKVFLLFGLITGFMLGGFFGYITSSAYLYIDEFGLSPREFGVVTGVGMVTNAVSHLVVGNLIGRYGPLKVMKGGISFVVIALILMALMTFYNVRLIYLLLLPILFFNMALGFTFPPCSTLAFERFPEASGAASAFLASLRMALLGVGTFLAGHFYNGTLISISSLFILFASLTVVSFLWLNKLLRREQRKI